LDNRIAGYFGDYLGRSGVQGIRQLDAENAMKNMLADIARASKSWPLVHSSSIYAGLAR
jgi:hypothetical protein